MRPLAYVSGTGVTCLPFATCARVLVFVRTAATAVVTIGAHHLLAGVSMLYPVRTSQSLLVARFQALVLARAGTVVSEFSY